MYLPDRSLWLSCHVPFYRAFLTAWIIEAQKRRVNDARTIVNME